MAKDDYSDLGFVTHDESQDHSDLGFMPEDQTDKVEALKAGLEHFGNSASLGYLPQLQAMAEEPMTTGLDLLSGSNVSNSLPDYVSRRDENVKRLEQEAKDYPKSSLAGDVGGSLASGAAASSLAPLNAATLAGRALQAGRAGALIGAASNPGDIEGEVSPFQLKERGINAAISSALSIPLQAGAEGAGKLGGYLSDKAKSIAESKAFKALGPDLRKVRQNFDSINDIGRSALDDGIIGKIPRDYSTLAERAGASKEAAGKKIEEIVNDLASKEGIPALSRNEMADKLREALISDSTIPGVAAKNAKLNSLIDEFDTLGSDKTSYLKQIPLKDARALKHGVSDQIKWDRLPGADIPIEEQFHRALYSSLKNGEEGIAEQLAKQGSIPNSDEFLKAKKLYGNLATAERVSQDQAERQAARQFLGLKDALSGATGAAVGGYLGDKVGGYEGAKMGAAVGGSVGTLGSKVAHNYGNQISAKSMDAFSKFLAQSPKLAAFVEKNPAMAPMLLNTLKKKELAQPIPQEEAPLDDQLLGRFRKNPQLIDTLTNEKLKEQVQRALDRKPADNQTQRIVPESEAQKMFLEGN